MTRSEVRDAPSSKDLEGVLLVRGRGAKLNAKIHPAAGSCIIASGEITMSRPTLRLNSGYPDSSPYLRDAVKELQRELQRWGFELPATGLFGPDTLSAVRSFQHKQGIEDDGIVGTNTWRLLASTKATNIGSSFRGSVPPAPRSAVTDTAILPFGAFPGELIGRRMLG